MYSSKNGLEAVGQRGQELHVRVINDTWCHHGTSGPTKAGGRQVQEVGTEGCIVQLNKIIDRNIVGRKVRIQRDTLLVSAVHNSTGSSGNFNVHVHPLYCIYLLFT